MSVLFGSRGDETAVDDDIGLEGGEGAVHEGVVVGGSIRGGLDDEGAWFEEVGFEVVFGVVGGVVGLRFFGISAAGHEGEDSVIFSALEDVGGVGEGGDSGVGGDHESVYGAKGYGEGGGYGRSLFVLWFILRLRL